MHRIIYFISFLHLTIHSFAADNFPNELLNEQFAIKTTAEKIAGIDTQVVIPFQGNAVNRNHYYDTRNGNSVQFIVLNYTASNFLRTMDIFTKDIPEGRVSAHYVMTQPEPENDIQGGLLYQIAAEDKTAWYINPSSWTNIQDLNDRAIGIALVNKGFEENSDKSRKWFTFDLQQIDVLGKLCAHLIGKYNIPSHQILGRGDVAPYRTEGPGVLFPWEYLHTNYSVGAWLTPQERNANFIKDHFRPVKDLPATVDKKFFLDCLKGFGYDVKDNLNAQDFENILKVFKAHFSCNQFPDQYATDLNQNDMLWAWGLEAKYSTMHTSKL